MKNPICCPEMAEYLNAPHVSLVVPFEPKMKNKIELQKVLACYAAQTEKDLLRKYEPQEVRNVMKKLKSVISKIDDPADKSIAIFISRGTEKVIYFDHSDYVQNHPLPKC